MNNDSLWEDIFSTREWGKYPPEELIRFVARNYYSASPREEVHLLEVGCGAGANVWYMARERFAVHGVDGSSSAIRKANKRLQDEKLKADLRVGDITQVKSLFASSLLFDGIVDVCCLQCNRLKVVDQVIGDCWQMLKPGGKFFTMLLAEGSYGSQLGEEVEPGSVVNISAGPLKGMGLNHFFTLQEVHDLFRAYCEVRIEYSLWSLNNMQETFKHWIVVATKPQE
jgi:SAM-dependent methyltransferase